MKKLLLLFAFILGAVAASAQTSYVTFVSQDGSEVSRGTEGLVIKFADGKMTVTTPREAALTMELTSLKSFFFSANPTAIKQVEASSRPSAGVVIRNGQLFVDGEQADNTAKVYSIDGRQIPANARLESGAYVVRIGNATYKIFAR